MPEPIYEITDYDLVRSAILECIMADFEWEEVYTIIDHAETAFEFDVSVATQLELNRVVAEHYGWTNEDDDRLFQQ